MGQRTRGSRLPWNKRVNMAALPRQAPACQEMALVLCWPLHPKPSRRVHPTQASHRLHEHGRQDKKKVVPEKKSGTASPCPPRTAAAACGFLFLHGARLDPGVATVPTGTPKAGTAGRGRADTAPKPNRMGTGSVWRATTARGPKAHHKKQPAATVRAVRGTPRHSLRSRPAPFSFPERCPFGQPTVAPP